MSGDRPVLIVRDATRRFASSSGTTVALHPISFDVRSGEILAIVGPSGSGKTTLLNLLIGWDVPTAGSIERSARLTSDWSGIAVVPQEIGLVPELTAEENVEIVAAVGHASAPAGPVLEQLGLADVAHRRQAQLSLGEQQRVAIARAVVARPGVLVADEPTAHQDERNGDRILGALVDCAAHRSAVVIATHDERLLAGVDRIVRLGAGAG